MIYIPKKWDEENLNADGIFLQDVFMLNYFGVYVFFQVCETRPGSVFLIELATKRYKDGTSLRDNLDASKDPLVVLENNLWTKSTYEVVPVWIVKHEPWLPIQVDVGSKLFEEAVSRGCDPYPCIAYAVPVEDYCHKYWVGEKKRKNIKKSYFA